MNAAARDFWRFFFLQSRTGIWTAEIRRPLSLTIPFNLQYAHLSHQAYLTRCNMRFAEMCGYRNPRQLGKKPLTQFFPRPDHSGEDILAQFVHEGCRNLFNAISRDWDHEGNHFYFRDTVLGVFNSGRVVGLWGIRDVVTKREWRLQEQKKLISGLTRSQRNILEMTVHGRTLKEIGAALSLSINTVESYRLRALRKLELRSVPELLRHASALGLGGDGGCRTGGAGGTDAVLLAR